MPERMQSLAVRSRPSSTELPASSSSAATLGRSPAVGIMPRRGLVSGWCMPKLILRTPSAAGCMLLLALLSMVNTAAATRFWSGLYLAVASDAAGVALGAVSFAGLTLLAADEEF